MPPIRNEIHTAAPATAPASPSRAKMPAPIIEPIPSTVAPRSVIVRARSPAGASAGASGGAAQDAASPLIRSRRAHGLGPPRLRARYVASEEEREDGAEREDRERRLQPRDAGVA